MEDLSHYNPEGSELRRAQWKMLEILEVFDGICRRHGINYWLACGTLLGARRHGGFIPWDDDLDVVVLQSDYKKIISVLKKELPESLKVQSRETDEKYWWYFPKIRDLNSRIHEKRHEASDYKGIFIDIFPIEPVPSMQFKRIIDKFLFSEVYIKGAESLGQKLKYSVTISFIPIIRFIIMLTRLYYKYLSSSKDYAYAFGVFFYSKYNMKYFFPVSDIIFEGKRFKAPSNIDEYLVDNFDSNFMVIPKPSDRTTHSSKIEFF